MSSQQRLTGDQEVFAMDFAAYTGLNLDVVRAWVDSEENGSYASGRERAGNNDWLNIGYEDSGAAAVTGEHSIWSNPRKAAQASAEWLRGKGPIAGSYGKPTGAVAAIARTAGQHVSAQLHAIQASGWASSGYPDLPDLYDEISKELPVSSAARRR